jgi:DNA mismatch repair protein MutS
VHSELDDVRRLRDDARLVIVDLETRLRAETGIGSLKVKHNNVLGYHIEISAANAEKLKATDSGQKFIHRQTTAQAMRYTNVELSELATRIVDAADRAQAISGRTSIPVVVFPDGTHQVEPSDAALRAKLVEVGALAG